jgi:hypothetical protein
MAPDPVVFATANPDPEITYEEAKAARPDVIIATGRSDYPNQVNNVLGFPFIFRGALDVRATAINEEMKLAATHALAGLAREDVPDSVCRAYGVPRLQFGREYLIPKPFDPRVLMWEASAVAEAAMRSGVAQEPIDVNTYRAQLERRLGKTYEVSRHDSQGSGQSQAGGLSRGRQRKNSACLSCAGGRKDWTSHPARGARENSEPRAGVRRESGRHADCRSGELQPPRILHSGTVSPSATAWRHTAGSPNAD